MMNKEERVLNTLSYLTNGALNYYQAPQTVMVRESLIREYIEDLQQRIDKIMEIIELNQYSYGYQIKDEILGGKE